MVKFKGWSKEELRDGRIIWRRPPMSIVYSFSPSGNAETPHVLTFMRHGTVTDVKRFARKEGSLRRAATFMKRTQGVALIDSTIVDVTKIRMPITKIMRVGTIPEGNRRVSVFIKVQIPSHDFSGRQDYVSVTGTIGPLPSGNALGSSGQIDMGFAHRNPADNDTRYSKPIPPSRFNFAPGWNRNKWWDLLDFWKKYHLKRELPKSQIEFIKSLPDADMKPAWI